MSDDDRRRHADRDDRRRRRGDSHRSDDRRPHRRDTDAGAAAALGGTSLGLGILALLGSMIPCVGMFAIVKASLALGLGITGIAIANKKKQGTGLPIAGTVVSGLAVGLCVMWMVVGAAFFKRAADVTDEAIERSNERAAELRERAQAEADEARQRQLLADLAADRAREEIRAGAALPVTAEKLDRDYSANVVAADASYKGKVLEVSGTVVHVIRTTGPVRYTVELDTAGGVDPVGCNFRPADKGPLADIAGGQRVTVRGRCKGLTDDGVILEDCLLVK
jgi:hypothetical protein